MVESGIIRDARRLRLAVIAAAILLGLAYVSARLGAGAGVVRLEGSAGGGMVARLLTDLRMLLLLVALVQLVRMLRGIESGAIISAEVTGRFRGFAYWLMLFALVGVALPLIVNALDHNGGSEFAIRLDFDDLLAFGLTLLLFLLARILERANRIEEEMREIV